MKISAMLALAAGLLGGLTLSVLSPTPKEVPAPATILIHHDAPEALHPVTEERGEPITIPTVLIVGERVKPARVEAKEKTWTCTGGWKDLQQGVGQYRTCGWQ